MTYSNTNYPEVKNLFELADFLENLDDSENADIGFDMRRPLPSSSDHPCGTACCIGGWVSLLSKEVDKFPTLQKAIMSLDENVEWEEADQLCYPTSDFLNNPYDVTAKQAAKVVRHLAKTGETNWNIAFEEE